MPAVFNGLSDSSLNSLSTWLHLIGLVGVVCVAVSFAGGYFVNGQLVSRADKTVTDEGHLLAAARAESATEEVQEKHTQQELADALAANAARQLTEAQRHDFIAALKDAPKGPVEVYIYDDHDTEVQRYANQVRDTLIMAGYDCGEKISISSKPFSPEGILVVVEDPRNAPVYAGAIQHAFAQIGIDAPAARDSNLDSDRVVVVVGRKFD